MIFLQMSQKFFANFFSILKTSPKCSQSSIKIKGIFPLIGGVNPRYEKGKIPGNTVVCF